MGIYHVETRETYDELMIELEEKGYKWHSGYKPTSKNYWEQEKENTCIDISGKDIFFRNIEQCKKQFPYTTIIEYKEKGDNMEITQEEMKQKLHENALDVFVKVQPFYKSTSESESDLKEAKSSAKKLIEKIDEYLESQKPKFKVGDYVTYEGIFENKIAKIDSINEDALHGLWYGQEKEGIRQDWWLKGGQTVRHATDREIEEYKVALTFHKHGRKPYEVKEGDILRDDKGNIFFVGFPNNFKKECFTSGKYTLLKTVEEYNEWLKNK